MLGRFTVVEVRDPHLIGQAVWNSLPPSEKVSITDASALEWAPLDRHRFRPEPESYWTEYAYAKFGGMYACHRRLRHAFQHTLASDGRYLDHSVPARRR